MPKARNPLPGRVLLVPVRALVIAFLLTLLAFAVSLLLAILVLVVRSRILGLTADLRIAYREVALPVAAVAAALALLSALVLEIRHYRQDRTLEKIERGG